jgi:hypothetical protein
VGKIMWKSGRTEGFNTTRLPVSVCIHRLQGNVCMQHRQNYLSNQLLMNELYSNFIDNVIQ